MLSPKTKRNIYRILPFGIIWLIFSIVYVQLEKGILGNLGYYPSTGNPYNFKQNIFVTPLLALIAGLLIGTIEVVYLNKIFILKSFSRKIVYKSLIYLATILSFILILSFISNATDVGTGVFSKEVWDNVWKFFWDYSFFSVCFFMASVILVSQFYAEVSENIGHGILHNFFTGKYHSPTEEERIFMFLDMKSSSTIAEKIGHVRYFEMLREYYSDLSDPIIRHSGEVYQYVGDEIIVTWRPDSGLKNNRCIQCFLEMKSSIKQQAHKYDKKFGYLPEFKAGFHMGKVTTGEIGDIKKEIIFTGDTLNTTARIQGLCNLYKTDILISADLMKNLTLDPSIKIKSLGENELKGKEEKIELFTLVQ
jgi:class 3 adenylate cyclase